MKKLFLTVGALFCGATAYALPAGNPSDASLLTDGLFWEGSCGDPCDPCADWSQCYSFRVGFYGDYVFNRYLKIDTKGARIDGRMFDTTRLSTNAAFLALNLFDRLDLFSTLGVSFLSGEANSAVLGNPGGREFLESSSRFSWSVGTRGTIWECGCTAFGFEAQYFRSELPIIMAIFDALVTDNSPNITIRYEEWQAALGVAQRLGMGCYTLVPYANLTWSVAKPGLIVEGQRIGGLKSAKPWGCALGVTMVDSNKASLTAEFRCGSEQALYVNGQIRL